MVDVDVLNIFLCFYYFTISLLVVLVLPEKVCLILESWIMMAVLLVCKTRLVLVVRTILPSCVVLDFVLTSKEDSWL